MVKKEVKLEEISAAGDYGEFTKVIAWDGLTQQTIWEGGVPTPVEIEVGRSWELLCFYKGYNAGGGWNITVSMTATGVPSAYRKQALGDRYELWIHAVEDRKDFNMGKMPDGPVTIRLKLWTSNLYTIQKPPESEW